MKVKVRKANPIHVMTYKFKREMYKRRTQPEDMMVYDPYTNTTFISKREYMYMGEINRMLDDVLGTSYGNYDDVTPGPWRLDVFLVKVKLPYSIHNSEPEEVQ